MDKSVSKNGQLRVEGINLVNQYGEPIQLKGMSSHGLQWYPEHTKKDAIQFTKEHGSSIWRAAMYTDEEGYIGNEEKIKAVLTESIDDAIALDMYAIIDWHILADNNPMQYIDEAKLFFDEMSKRYAGVPNVIYEICNEPNGDEVLWDTVIKPYAKEIIPIIRKNHKQAVISVGTGKWSQLVDDAAKNPLEYDNIMYSMHFYAGTHGEELRNRVDFAREKGCAIFVTEWGATTADGAGGKIYKEETNEWIRFINERNLSWCNWSFGSRKEASAALKPDAKPGEYSLDSLTESGSFVFSLLQQDR